MRGGPAGICDATRHLTEASTRLACKAVTEWQFEELQVAEFP